MRPKPIEHLRLFQKFLKRYLKGKRLRGTVGVVFWDLQTQSLDKSELTVM
jgi:hypothetical protein